MLSLQVYHDEDLYHYVDGCDVDKSNWMRHVNPANSLKQQNLVACQVKLSIFFYTIKSIPPNTELLVWYCREFAQRLNYPLATSDRQLGKTQSAPVDNHAVKGTPEFWQKLLVYSTYRTEDPLLLDVNDTRVRKHFL